MSLLRILLVDDHILVRGGTRLLLENISGITVVAEASDGHEALHLIAELSPEIVITDIAMPGMNGLELTTKIKQAFPDIKVLILSMYDNEEYVAGALQAGVSGYLVKDSAIAELSVALE